MIRFKRIIIQPYEAPLWLFKGDGTLDEVVVFMTKKFKVEHPARVLTNWKAATYPLQHEDGSVEGIACVFSSVSGLETKWIYHESLHVVYEIFNAIGISLGYENQEQIAYMQGYVADEIIKFISK
jgi:hypothetical protein